MSNKSKQEHLSKRQLDVLKLIYMSDGDIAKCLGLSISTVKTHLTNLRIKFLASNKIEILVVALKSGVITIDEIEFS